MEEPKAFAVNPAESEEKVLIDWATEANLSNIKTEKAHATHRVPHIHSEPGSGLHEAVSPGACGCGCG